MERDKYNGLTKTRFVFLKLLKGTPVFRKTDLIIKIPNVIMDGETANIYDLFCSFCCCISVKGNRD